LPPATLRSRLRYTSAIARNDIFSIIAWRFLLFCHREAEGRGDLIDIHEIASLRSQ
jgi:hypothetical protein